MRGHELRIRISCCLNTCAAATGGGIVGGIPWEGSKAMFVVQVCRFVQCLQAAVLFKPANMASKGLLFLTDRILIATCSRWVLFRIYYRLCKMSYSLPFSSN